MVIPATLVNLWLIEGTDCYSQNSPGIPTTPGYQSEGGWKIGNVFNLNNCEPARPECVFSPPSSTEAIDVSMVGVINRPQQWNPRVECRSQKHRIRQCLRDGIDDVAQMKM